MAVQGDGKQEGKLPFDNGPPQSSPTASVFKYGDSINGEQFRRLILEPSTTLSSAIKCQLWTASRNDTFSYEALSYSWGKSKSTTSIMVNGCSLEIREGLASALRHLRLLDIQRTLWIDAICINQEDISEKNHQVRRMDEIYSKASSVIVWLGPSIEEEQSILGMRAIDRLGSQFNGKSLNHISESTLYLPPSIDIEGESFGPGAYLIAIHRLLARDWFDRLWVIQEVCFAPAEHVTVACGSETIRFERLTNLQLSLACLDPRKLDLSKEDLGLLNEHRRALLARMWEPPIGLTRQFFTVKYAEIQDLEKWKRNQLNQCHLLTHLWNFRNRNCTNPRDRIYALRSLVCDVSHQDIEPDYNEPLAHTFAKATKAIMLKHHKLDVMFMCPRPEPTETSQGHTKQRPSWAPNFDLNPIQWPINSLTVWMPGNDRFYKATVDSVAEPQFSDDLSELTLRGYDIDEITEVAQFQILTPADQRPWRNALLQCWKLAQRNVKKANQTEEQLHQAFGRTLITNRSSTRTIATAEVEDAEFDQFWEFVEDPEKHSIEDLPKFSNYNAAFFAHSFRRSFFVTQDGCMGLAPLWAREKDRISLLAGAQVPFALRMVEGREGRYQVIGECYVHGIMYGSRWKQLESKEKDPLLLV